MDDYIKREDALSLVHHSKFDTEDDKNYVMLLLGKEYGCQSADVAPVRHGRWKTYKTEVAGRGFFYCTKCRADAYDATNYCPNCGAKMDEETK